MGAGGGRLYALFKVTSGSIVKGVELLGVSGDVQLISSKLRNTTAWHGVI